MRATILALLAATFLPGCQRAGRYPAPIALTEPQPETKTAPPPHWAWLPMAVRPDLPIRFVDDTNPDWQRLAARWNHMPPLHAGMRTLHLGLPPLGAAAAMVMSDASATIAIKVPRGLPDPTPLIPDANPPTFGRWQLGQKIFTERAIKLGSERFACATCHQPQLGFTQQRAYSIGGAFNTLSLLNVAYNRSQFWDGRVQTLEQTVARTLDDELIDEDLALQTHRWGGLVQALAGPRAYREEFRRVFGIDQPTQDAIAKALATYLRTLLAGDSLYDRAEAERRRRQASELAPEDWKPHLDDKALARLSDEKLTPDEAARRLAHGARLFQGKARCGVCHPAPLFTDHDFHNVGLGESDSTPPPGAETGRFAAVPIGLKEARLTGAFRTPTLRNLPRTVPYFHDGKRRALLQVVRFFDLHVDWENPYLAQALRDAGHEGRLELSPDEVEALVLFLQALDGNDTGERGP